MSNIPLQERAKWVGGSESAALFGLSPYITRFELWHQKAGSLPPHNLDGQERVLAGQFFEPAIGAWAQHKWNWPLRKIKAYLANERVRGMGASLDFMAVDGGEPVEIKNVDSAIFHERWVADGDEIVDAPTEFVIQVQHEIACMPHRPERGWLVACAGGNRLYRMEIPRHDGFIAKLEQEVEAFWETVRERREPKPDFALDADAISLLYNIQGDTPIDLRDDERFAELCAEYLDAHEVEVEASARKKAALAEIKTIMRDAPIAFGANGYVVKSSAIKEGTYTRKAHRRFLVQHKPTKEL